MEMLLMASVSRCMMLEKGALLAGAVTELNFLIGGVTKCIERFLVGLKFREKVHCCYA